MIIEGFVSTYARLQNRWNERFFSFSVFLLRIAHFVLVRIARAPTSFTHARRFGGAPRDFFKLLLLVESEEYWENIVHREHTFFIELQIITARTTMRKKKRISMDLVRYYTLFFIMCPRTSGVPWYFKPGSGLLLLQDEKAELKND